MKLKEIFKNRKIITVLVVVIVLIITGAWYYYSVTSSYEIKLIKNEEYTLWIGFQQYKFSLIGTYGYYSGQQMFDLKVTSGNSTETRCIGTLSQNVGNTYKFLDLEVYKKEALVDGIRIVVRKW